MSKEYLTLMPLCFEELELNDSLIKAIEKSGYTIPTPIQAKMIPHVMAGRDVVGQAQTGTGKTAAFALPLLHRLMPAKKVRPQILVLTPTRELALQVAESFQTYGQFLKHLRVLAIFGGQDYAIQLRQLERGVNVVVGTPGRVMDHIRRGTLQLSSIHSMVLDEADEMLKMGFLEDVEWILEQVPQEKQIALFSATMPPTIRRIAKKHLTDPVEITITNKTVSAPDIRQQYLLTKGIKDKTEALRRILEVETFEGMLIFVRTKIQTVELSEYLVEQGYICGALNGDIAQNQRLRMVDQLKSGKLNILVATDVAARGLDVDRISHVVNFDIPFDAEAYIHRIGRTGRAGRSGKAILFLQAREKSMLKAIERATGQKIELMQLPTIAEMQRYRREAYKNEITATLGTDLSFFQRLIEEFCEEQDVSPVRAAAALAKMGQSKGPLLQAQPQQSLVQEPKKTWQNTSDRRAETTSRPPRKRSEKRENATSEQGMDRYRIEIGSAHGVKPGNIVGAIANEADLGSEFIGRINIFDDYSTVDLPYGMPQHILTLLQNTYILDMQMRLKKEDSLSDAAQHYAKGETASKKQTPNKSRSAKPGRQKGKRTFQSAATVK